MGGYGQFRQGISDSSRQAFKVGDCGSAWRRSRRGVFLDLFVAPFRCCSRIGLFRLRDGWGRCFGKFRSGGGGRFPRHVCLVLCGRRSLGRKRGSSTNPGGPPVRLARTGEGGNFRRGHFRGWGRLRPEEDHESAGQYAAQQKTTQQIEQEMPGRSWQVRLLLDAVEAGNSPLASLLFRFF